jgi:aldehyde dehydrogenase (NAD+)
VVVNDFLIPTADPRVSFGGRGESGFGVTRGPEGLREMTRPKAVLEQTSPWRPHLDPPEGDAAAFFKTYLRAAHVDGLSNRLRNGWAFVKACLDARRQSERASPPLSEVDAPDA